jgi:hypothetical protein
MKGATASPGIDKPGRPELIKHAVPLLVQITPWCLTLLLEYNNGLFRVFTRTLPTAALVPQTPYKQALHVASYHAATTESCLYFP